MSGPDAGNAVSETARAPDPATGFNSDVTSPRDTMRLLGVWAVLTAAATWLAWLKQPGQVDDAFIYLRYARNVVEGRGWVYNDGEWVNGATSTGNTLLLILFSLLTGGRYVLAQILIFGLGAGTAATGIWALLRGSGRTVAWFGAAMLLSTPYLWWLAGMDTAPILCFATTAVWAYARGRILLASLLLSLLFLVRPDGVFLVLLLLGHYVWSSRRDLRAIRRPLLLGTLIFAVPILAWVVYSIATFGTALPKTLGAKLAQTESGIHGPPQSRVVLFLIDLPVPLFVRNVVENLRLFLSIRLGAAGALWFELLAVLGLAGTIAGSIGRKALTALVLWGLLQCIAYAVLNLPNYLWYYVPFTFALTLAIALLVASLWRTGRARATRITARIAAVAVALAFLWPAAPDPRRITTDTHPGYLHYKSESHYPHYYELADWLRQQAPGGGSLACAEIGVLGFELPEFRIIDMWGLVTEGGVDAISRGDFTWWFEDVAPDWVLFHDPVWEGPEKAVFVLPDFQQRYELVHEASDRLVYRRKQ